MTSIRNSMTCVAQRNMTTARKNSKVVKNTGRSSNLECVQRRDMSVGQTYLKKRVPPLARNPLRLVDAQHPPTYPATAPNPVYPSPKSHTSHQTPVRRASPAPHNTPAHTCPAPS